MEGLITVLPFLFYGQNPDAPEAVRYDEDEASATGVAGGQNPDAPEVIRYAKGEASATGVAAAKTPMPQKS